MTDAELVAAAVKFLRHGSSMMKGVDDEVAATHAKVADAVERMAERCAAAEAETKRLRVDVLESRNNHGHCKDAKARLAAENAALKAEGGRLRAELAAAKGEPAKSCPTCEGEGGWLDEGEPSTCDDCGGTGKVAR